MPLYEYSCRDCRNRFEKLVRSIRHADRPVECPKCNSTRTERSISVFAAVSGDGGKSSSDPTPGICGRCGGPGPCQFDE